VVALKKKEKNFGQYHEPRVGSAASIRFKYKSNPVQSTRQSKSTSGHRDRRISIAICLERARIICHSGTVQYTDSPADKEEDAFLNQLTPWSRVLPEKLTALQLVKNFLPFYGTRWFITALTSVCRLPLS
jgi:hypothetical protein